MSNMENSALSNYNSLLDRNLTGYFSNTKMRKHLVKSGMIDREGRITSENAYRMKMAKKEHRDNVRDLLASAIVDKALDMERMRRYEIRKRLEELYKIELVQKVSSERGKRGNDDLVALLTPRKSKPTGKSRKAKSAAVTKTEKIDMKLPSIHSMEKTRKFVENGDSSQSMLGGTSSHHPPPPRASSEKKLNPHPPPGRSKKKKRNIHRGLMLAKSDQMIAHRIQLQSMAEVTMKYLGSPLNLTNDMFPANKVSEVQIIQQHCGASTICVFKELLPANTLFTFVSRRHRGSPFGLTFYIDGIQNIRLSSCCEYKHRPGHKVGGKNSQFGLVAVQGAAPCYKCQVRLNLVGGGNKGKEKEEDVYSSDEEAAVKSYDIIVSRLGRHSDSRLERPESASVMTQTAGTVEPGSGRSSGQGDETNEYQDEVFEDDAHFAEMNQRDLSSDNAASSSSSEASDSESEAEENAEDRGVAEVVNEEKDESSAAEYSSDVPTDVPNDDDDEKDGNEEKDEEKIIPPQTSDNSASDSESSSDESVKSIQEKVEEEEDKQVSSETEEASDTEDEKAAASVEEKDTSDSSDEDTPKVEEKNTTDTSDEDAPNVDTAEKEASSEDENTLSAPSSENDSDVETKNEKDADGVDSVNEEDTEVEEGEATENEGEKILDEVVAEEPSEGEVGEADDDGEDKPVVSEESTEEKEGEVEEDDSRSIPEHKDVEDDVDYEDENIREEENLDLPDIEGKGSDSDSDGDISDNRATSVISRESTMLTGNEDGEFDGVNITIKFNEEVDVVTYAKGDSTSAEETPRSDGSDAEFDSTTVSGGTVNLTTLNDDDDDDDHNDDGVEESVEESGEASDSKTDEDGEETVDDGDDDGSMTEEASTEDDVDISQ